MTSTPNSNPAALHHNVIPSEVGWQFVPQYYTFVNKQPNRLHCFYTKSSTFIHGTEGEDGKPCYGQQEIHNKITSIGFEDCKVFIHSVDAQSSANGGIIIQVIGEMSNHGDPWRKFVQTFFLAEQPNGYFVLNDIFRFLKEETVEGDDDEAEPENEVAPAPTVSVPTQEPPVVEPAAPPTPEPEPAPVVVAPTAEEEPPTTLIPEATVPTPEPTPPPQKVNGVHAESEPAPAAVEPPREPTPEPNSPVAPSQPIATPTPPPPAQLAAAPAPQPQPAAPLKPKTWANLAAANSTKWGAAVATESRAFTEVPAATVVTPTSSGAQTPHHHPGNGSARPVHPAILAAQSLTTAQCFIKGVQEPVTQAALMSTLTSRFGPIKDHAEIVRSKACAFLEFQSVDSAKRAIIASLPVGQGGEGGININVGGDVGIMRIIVETKKERGDRPPSRPRGGPPVNGGGDARGGFRGRGAPGGGRGRTPPK